MGNTQQTQTQNRPNKPNEEEEKQEEEEEEEEQSNNGFTFTCEICIEPISPPNKNFKNGTNCTHPFCTDCIIKYISVQIQDNNLSTIKCPALNCHQLLDPLCCRALIPRQLFDKWCDNLCDSALLGLDRCYCPNRECSALVVNECGGRARRSVCPKCKDEFCFECRVKWHAGYRCEESGEVRDGNDVAFGVLVERCKWRRCPRCRHFVELIEGCSIVKCRCGTNFCYKCGKNVNQHWCECHGPRMGCIWLFRICLFLMIFFPLFFLYADAIGKIHF